MTYGRIENDKGEGYMTTNDNEIYAISLHTVFATH